LFSKTAEGLGPMAAAGSRGSWRRRRTGVRRTALRASAWWRDSSSIQPVSD